ncbi:MAG: helix-hairpin-helix domain-containing protein [Firmicutes bacterium]|nr:helix-hairpin-helix domain-containing protein [Bacillota bacterium]
MPKLAEKWRSRLLMLVAALAIFGCGTLYGEYRAEQAQPQVTVQISGEAASPGLITLPAGSRVADAVAACGITEQADLSRLNLAAYLIDGETLLIPRLPDAAGLLININSATADQLDALPNIGIVRAEDIIAYREQHGAFNSIEELMRVKGIGESIYAELEELICVE